MAKAKMTEEKQKNTHTQSQIWLQNNMENKEQRNM